MGAQRLPRPRRPRPGHRAQPVARRRAGTRRRGERAAGTIIAAAHAVLAEAGIAPEYLELRDADTLQPITLLDGDALLAVAAQVGAARLIDNHTLRSADRRGDA